MSLEMTEHDRYVAKVNSLVESGNEQLVDEVTEEYLVGRHLADEVPGAETFWAAPRSAWVLRELLRD